MRAGSHCHGWVSRPHLAFGWAQRPWGHQASSAVRAGAMLWKGHSGAWGEVCVCELRPAHTWSAPILHPATHPGLLCLHCPGERGLEVRRHGDRPPVPLDLCLRLCLRHHRHVPAASLPELHRHHLPPSRPLGSQLQVRPRPRSVLLHPSALCPALVWMEEGQRTTRKRGAAPKDAPPHITWSPSPRTSAHTQPAPPDAGPALASCASRAVVPLLQGEVCEVEDRDGVGAWGRWDGEGPSGALPPTASESWEGVCGGEWGSNSVPGWPDTRLLAREEREERGPA